MVNFILICTLLNFQDTNFQVLKVKLDIVRIIAERLNFTLTTADFAINDVTEKLADPKNGGVAAQVLTAMAEATKLENIVSKVLSFAFEQKSPKVQSESLNWVNQAIREFGFQVGGVWVDKFSQLFKVLYFFQLDQS